MDSWEILLLSYPTIQKIILIIIIIGVVLALLFKIGLLDAKIVILSIALIFIYLYAVEVISSVMFVISLGLVFIVLYITKGKRRESE